MGLEALLRGWVSRTLPQAETDNDPGVVRLARYQEVYVVPLVRKQHAHADEGDYFVANNGQTGLAAGVGTAFSATAATLIITNTDAASNLNNKRIHLDYVALQTTAAGSAASGLTALFAALVVDSGNRYSSGGTNLSALIVNPNMDVGQKSSVAQVYFGALTATAASGSARTVCGQRVLRIAVSGAALGVINETMHLNFGGVESPGVASYTIANAGMWGQAFPPVVIGPGQSLLLHTWFPSTTPVAPSYAPEVGWWER